MYACFFAMVNKFIRERKDRCMISLGFWIFRRWFSYFLMYLSVSSSAPIVLTCKEKKSALKNNLPKDDSLITFVLTRLTM